MVDYSKWDNIAVSSSDEEQESTMKPWTGGPDELGTTLTEAPRKSCICNDVYSTTPMEFESVGGVKLLLQSNALANTRV